MKGDRELKKDIEEELNWEPSVEASAIGVEVEDGVVTLTGHVNSYLQKWAAERAVKRVHGINAVAIEIDVNIPAINRRTDADIARAAVNALEWDDSVPGPQIKVMVEDGWVTLEGGVDWEFQRSAAQHDVQRLAGVRGVSNQIHVRPQVSPANVKERIEAALRRRADIDAKGVSVSVDGGVVILSGKVNNWSEREAVKEAAWAAPGVYEVHDKMTLVY